MFFFLFLFSFSIPMLMVTQRPTQPIVESWTTTLHQPGPPLITPSSPPTPTMYITYFQMDTVHAQQGNKNSAWYRTEGSNNGSVVHFLVPRLCKIYVMKMSYIKKDAILCDSNSTFTRSCVIFCTSIARLILNEWFTSSKKNAIQLAKSNL